MRKPSSNIKVDLQDKLRESPFPNIDIDPKVKQEPKFGSEVAKYIYNRHTYDEYFNGRRSRIATNRAYAEGRQDPDQYKPRLDYQTNAKNDATYLNINWDNIVSPAPKYVDLLVGDMINVDYKIQFNAIDPVSRSVHSKKRDEFFGKLIRKQIAEQLEAATGVPLESKMSESDPQSPEEIDLYMSMAFKQDVEIAFEELVDFELYNNDIREIKTKICRDLVENSEGRARLWFDENDKPRLRYVDIEFYISSQTDKNDFSDVEYQGEVRLITIRELRRIGIKSGLISEEDLFDIAKKSAESNKNGRWDWGNYYSDSRMYNGREYGYDDFRVEVLDFILYTIDVENWEYKQKKNGSHFLNKKDYSYSADESKKYNRQKLSKEIEMEYEGVYVPCCNKMAQWSRSKNMIRVKSNDTINSKCQKKYIGYAKNNRYGTPVSLIDRIRPHLDNIQLHSLKMQQFVAEAAPPGVGIDIDALTDIALQEGQKATPMEIIKMYRQKGVLVYSRRSSVDGEYLNGAPIEQMPNGIGEGLIPFISAIQWEIQQIQEYTGLNPARDATKPDERAAVGVQKLQLLNSNNTTRELFNAWIYGIYEKIGYNLALMIQMRLSFSQSAVKAYSNVISRLGVDAIKNLSDRVDTIELGIKTEALPSGEEIERLNRYIEIALQSQEITMEDAFAIRGVMNTKKAEQMLVIKKRQREKAKMEQRMQEEQIISQREQQAAMARAEAESMIDQVKTNNQIKLIEIEYQKKIELERIKGENLRAVAHIRGDSELEKIELASQVAEQREDNAAAITPKAKSDLVPNVRDPNMNTDPIGAALEV